MKKGQTYIGIVDAVHFPNKGIISASYPAVRAETGAYVLSGAIPDASGVCAPDGAGVCVPDTSAVVTVKNTIPGQRIAFSIAKKRKGKAEGRLLAVLEKSPVEMNVPVCPHFGICGGCNYQSLPYAEQLKLKSNQVLELLREAVPNVDEIFGGIRPSPRQFGYRNKMEYTFGDGVKDGPLTVGMHKRGGFYDIVTVDRCQIVDNDYRKILSATETYFREKGTPFYHRMRHVGYLRHLLVRKAVKTGEILVDLITTTQDCENWGMPEKQLHEAEIILNKGSQIVNGTDNVCRMGATESNKEMERDLLQNWMKQLLALHLDGSIAGILHTKNDSVADAVKNEGTEILYGKDYFYEELLGLKFKISPFSFFQTNSLGAEVLYDTARSFIREALQADGASLEGKTVYDLYSGTGTIAQMLAGVSGKVIGVEIVEEAVEAARENAALNGLKNCEFIAGDVLKVLDEIPEKPDFIVLDPPRDGIHPKALEKIVRYGADRMIYISCKPTSLRRDLEILQARGYRAERICCVDLFPGTVHVETICSLSRIK